MKVTSPTSAMKNLDFTLEIPKNFVKISQFDYLIPHQSLRKFMRMIGVSEVDPEFNLKPTEIFFQDNLDPKLTDKIAVLKYEFLAKTPGFYGIFCMNNLRLEMSFYLKERLSLPYGFPLFFL